MSCSRMWIGILPLVMCTSSYGAVLVDATTLNGSFEAPPTAKQITWDTVEAWTDWGAAVGGPSTINTDSGTDVSAAASNGTHVAFLQANNAAYNLTSHVIQAGDLFAYSWDWVLPGRGIATAGLAYQDVLGNIVQIAGTTSSNPDTVTQHLGLGASFTAMAGDPAIGRPIALTIATTGNYPEVDNFVLTLNVVPGDVDGDGDVDLVDFGIIRDHFQIADLSREQGNLDSIGKVDFADFREWKTAFLEGGGSLDGVDLSFAVPEPTTMLLFLLGMLAGATALRGRRRVED